MVTGQLLQLSSAMSGGVLDITLAVVLDISSSLLLLLSIV
jgi:hypothetical protein